MCECSAGYIRAGKNHESHCVPENVDKHWAQKVQINTRPTAASDDYRLGTTIETEAEIEQKKAEFQNLIKWIVVFLLIMAVILCIALGAVIIWRYLNVRL